LVLGLEDFSVGWGVVVDEMEGIIVALGELSVRVGWDNV